jgi:hypothetical protein
MSSLPKLPRLLETGIVLLDPKTSAVLRIISLQYTPNSLTRSLQIQGVIAKGGGGDRSETLRLKEQRVETFKLEAEFDRTLRREGASDYPNEVRRPLSNQNFFSVSRAAYVAEQVRVRWNAGDDGQMRESRKEARIKTHHFPKLCRIVASGRQMSN